MFPCSRIGRKSERSGGVLCSGGGCDGCDALRAEHGSDPTLLMFYASNLLKKGWGGKLSDGERAYVRAHTAWANVNVAPDGAFKGLQRG